ncbi:helix-turn-helix domain-containing protein [Micromonospora craniellae]|uniref:helix-turn-helix domain-containing protein n=1 Tax=Micromonospora craniellae TaxID=2294034 RepID=UPI00168B9BA9|nr:helix-turn-helix domain-containing protein [Micromonospora craniellae]QOC89643.1 helix-turn-helix domain-containing protein [Micromonospora craniellae]
MRYPDGGGLSARGRAKREAVRRQAAGWFAEDVSVPEIARRLRVSQTAVYGWRKRWRAGGEQALASRGPGGSRCRLDEGRLRRLADALEEGPAAHGFGADQRWTLARVSDLIARMFRTRYTLRGTAVAAANGACAPSLTIQTPFDFAGAWVRPASARVPRR